MLAGAFKAKTKDNKIYYRSSITYKNKHISLGSYDTEEEANKAYLFAKKILSTNDINLLTYSSDSHILSYGKIISLINFRDNGIYIKNPIYLARGYFQYYLTPTLVLKFDNDDLFYYSSHAIIKRGGHLFVNDFGMQYNLLSRYGIKPYAVAGRDYKFANEDETDFRYSNIIIINKYNGVLNESTDIDTIYKAVIHVKGNFIIGRFPTEAQAAVAYNKACDYLMDHGINKEYDLNYVTEYSPSEYADVYTKITLPEKILKLASK